jgi:CBS domain-containing protein
MLAKDIMTTDLATVGPGQSIADVIRCMVERRVSGVPVLGADRALLGIVTEGDLLRRAEIGTASRRSSLLAFLLGSGRLAREYVETHTRAVEDVMTTEVTTVTPETELAEIVALMERHHVKRVPVLRDGACVGIVSRADIVAALGRALEAASAGACDDETIRARLREEMEKADWCGGTRIDIRVQDGLVELEGVIFDERERQALLVLARNTPGVKRCIDHITWIEPHTGMSYVPDEEPVKTPPTT